MIKCGEEVGEEDLDGTDMDGEHGQAGEEEIHIHSAGDFHGCLGDGGECHIIMDCHTTCHIHITAIHGCHGGE